LRGCQPDFPWRSAICRGCVYIAGDFYQFVVGWQDDGGETHHGEAAERPASDDEAAQRGAALVGDSR